MKGSPETARFAVRDLLARIYYPHTRLLSVPSLGGSCDMHNDEDDEEAFKVQEWVFEKDFDVFLLCCQSRCLVVRKEREEMRMDVDEVSGRNG